VAVTLVVGGVWQAILFFITPSPSQLAWGHDEIAAVAQAKANHQPVLIDFFAEWCLPCKELDARTFSKPEVAAELGRFALVKVDCTADDDVVAARKQRYDAKTLPAVILLGSDGELKARIDKFVPPDELIPLLQRVN
jgi:thiol:disulfide interchange protein DsbD